MITDKDIQDFVAAVQARHDAYFAKQGYSWTETFSADVGPKYVRIVNAGPAQRMVHCFVDRLTGDILKAAGWKAPAKRARGDIRNGADDLSDHGAVYLKSGRSAKQGSRA